LDYPAILVNIAPFETAAVRRTGPDGKQRLLVMLFFWRLSLSLQRQYRQNMEKVWTFLEIWDGN
jgi:hypothetical protein